MPTMRSFLCIQPQACACLRLASMIKNKFLSITALMMLSATLSAQTNMPIYAAHVSDDITATCDNSTCHLNVFDAHELTKIAETLHDAKELHDALATSEYEVIIASALMDIGKPKTAQLVMEITTTWRDVPIDEFKMGSVSSIHTQHATALAILSHWLEHVVAQEVLEPNKIYQTLEASNYHNELRVPRSIGEFVKLSSDVYRDPMQGSITRYTHPEYADAIVDIQVYPINPFKNSDAKTKKYNIDNLLNTELNNEIIQIKTLTAQANIQDVLISPIRPATITMLGQLQQGYNMEIQLNSQTVPIYSTQFVFVQNDKIIKLSGNIPQSMMTKLVTESLPHIVVPNESSFMKRIRQG